ASVGLAVKPLMLEEQYRIVTANRGSQQTSRIEGIGRKYHTQSRNVRENALAALRVVECASGQVPADRPPDHQGSRECIIRAPADHRQLVPQLHHRGPDVIEELNLDYWL